MKLETNKNWNAKPKLFFRKTCVSEIWHKIRLIRNFASNQTYQKFGIKPNLSEIRKKLKLIKTGMQNQKNKMIN